MKSSYPEGRRKHGIPLQSWGLILLIALALHLILFFLFRPLRSDVAESRRHDRYTVFLTEKELAGMRTDPHKLRYWLRYMDPERVLKSDPDFGFSMSCGKANVSIPDPVLFAHSMFSFSPEAEFQPYSLTAERPLSDFVSGADLPVTDIAPDRNPQPGVAVGYPIWTDEGGRVFSGLFHPDKNSLRLLKTQHSADPTFLQLQVHPGGIPYVKILRSCGNSQLDMLAARQLKVRKENFGSAAGVQVKYFMVSWQSPDHGNVLKKGQP